MTEIVYLYTSYTRGLCKQRLRFSGAFFIYYLIINSKHSAV